MTKTLNPLHFEDLEPHRFEDLVRQVIYDFKEWSSLEPTGRLGADDGYDARGFEILREETDVQSAERTDENEEDFEATPIQERSWQIQCKREKSISPTKIKKYLQEMIPKASTVPYGVIFAAPTDFSKKTRDAFREELRKKGVTEFYLWGKADLEDTLFQPKNDHLLYAYFGVSLQIRRRSQKSKLRGILATKRKAIKHLGPIDSSSFKEILVRDIDDDQYPDSRQIPNFKERPAWKKYYFVGHEHDGIQILIRRFFAYRDVDYAPDGVPKLKAWDFTDKTNLGPKDDWNNDPEDGRNHHRVFDFWNKLDEQKRAYFELIGHIKYENIIEIDAEGDIYVRCPHVYVRRVNDKSFCERFFHKLAAENRWGQDVYLPADADKVRIKVFPDEFPDPNPEDKDPKFESTGPNEEEDKRPKGEQAKQ
jgi:hypothetical protein